MAERTDDADRPTSDLTLPRHPLRDLAPGGWFKDRSTSSFWLLISTFAYASRPEVEHAFREYGSQESKADGQVLIAIGDIDGIELPDSVGFWSGEPDGSLHWRINVSQRKVARTDCIFIATPYRVDGADADLEAPRRIRRLVSLLSLTSGPNLLCDAVFEGEIDAGSGQVHVTGVPTRVPQPTEGPSLTRETFDCFRECLAGIRAAGDRKRGRLELALEYMDEGVRKYDDFFSYWTALELVVDGKAPTIRTRLQQCYGLKSHRLIDEQTGLPKLTAWRHAYIHRGIRPQLTADVARYIHLLFIELFRRELGLECLHLVEAIQSAPGFDLRPLGLADNRTEEQKSRLKTG